MASGTFIDTSQLRIAIVREMRAAVAGGIAGAVSEAAAVAAALGERIGNRADITLVHQNVAASMRLAIEQRYLTNVEARKTHYDYGPREGSPSRLQGVLLKALQDPEMVVGDARGITLGNKALLQGAAKHVFRLNFGTQGEGDHGPPARSYPINLFGSKLFNVTLSDNARPAIVMPPGLFLGASGKTGGGRPEWFAPDAGRRGTDIFFPIFGKQNEIKARAVEARRFLDAGLETMSKELRPAYNRLLQSWLTRDTRAGRIVVNVRNGQPSNLR